MTLDELKELMIDIGEKPYRATQVADWAYKKHVSDWKEATNLSPGLKQKMAETLPAAAIEFAEDSDSMRGDSTKFLFKTKDGRLLESVLISQQGRETVCVSTQLGCKIGCTFCASGKGAFGRNLSAGEIVEQIIWIGKKIKKKITNIVFMGMGEPLDNFEVTMKALEILQADWGLGLSGRRITVSTSGITPKIKEFVKRNGGRVRLSISLHSSIDKKRSELVPINKRYCLDELVRTLTGIHPQLKRFITFEYTLIKDQNDSKEEAEGVARIAAPLDAMVNIIPYNPIREMNYETPSQNKIDRFRKILTEKGVRVIVRQTAGRDIDAACGQLRLDREITQKKDNAK